MAGLRRTIHPQASFEWKKLKLLAPDIAIQVNEQVANGKAPPEPMGLAFIDPDGETHVYMFTEEGRVNLIRKLTGGLVVPSGG